MSWTKDDGLIDVTASFLGISQSIAEIVDDIHRRGWTVGKIHVKDDNYVAEGKNPHGEKVEATGRTDATAAANLLVKIMRREHMRSSAVKTKLGAWNHFPIEQQFAQIAQAYAGAPVYEPKAAPAWMELAQDCQRRAQSIRMQLAVEYTHDPVPYESADDMREDVTKKRHILVSRAYAHHPVWSEQQMLDYRLVVDVLGHAIGGGDWGWHGTCLAFAQLAPLLAESAQKALFTELLGQSAFGQFYRQWGPQKICFLEELIEKEQAKENKPGHTGVHPSQSIVPAMLPHIGAVVGTPTDPNANWESGVTPLQDNAYLWQRQDGIDPLDIQSVTDNLRPLETGISRMHPQMAKQAVVNALRSSLLDSRTNQMGHAIHYQDLMHIPADVDDPMAYYDALEQQRERWNQAKGYAPGSHKQHWPEEQQFKQWVKAANPHLDDGDVNRLAKREMLHMLMEEEERVLAQDQAEQLPAEVIEHEAYEAMKRRLKSLTKPNVDQKVDFGDHHLWHEAASNPRIVYHDDLDPCPIGGPPEGYWGRWPVTYDEANNALHIGPEGTTHGQLRDKAGLVSPRYEGWRGHNPEGDSGPNPEVHHVGGQEYGWYNGSPGPSINFAMKTFNYPRHPDSDSDQSDEGGYGHGYRLATHHADMYPPFLASRVRPIAQISHNANALAEAAREDLVSHKGHGHHFRATATSLGIPGLGPRQASHAWLHLAPQTSALGIINPEVAETLGHNYATDTTNRDYFKHERELAAGRDASGYGHVPLGTFSTGVYDQYAGGPGWHPDRSAFKVHAPTPHHAVNWLEQQPSLPGWPNPYWWASTGEARDQAAQDFDRTVGVNFNRDEIPFQKTAARSYYRWLPASIRDQVTQNGMVPNPNTDNPMHFWDNLENARRYGEICNSIEPHDLWEVQGRPGRLKQDPWFKMMAPGTYPEYGNRPGAWQGDADHIPADRLRRISVDTGGAAVSTQIPLPGPCPWVVHPETGERLTGAPGTSLMQHIKTSLGHPDAQSVWAQDYEVGKGSPGIIAKVAAAKDIGDYITTKDGYTFEVVDMSENPHVPTGMEYVVRSDLDGNDCARHEGQEGVDWQYVHIPTDEAS